MLSRAPTASNFRNSSIECIQAMSRTSGSTLTRYCALLGTWEEKTMLCRFIRCTSSDMALYGISFWSICRMTLSRLHARTSSSKGM